MKNSNKTDREEDCLIQKIIISCHQALQQVIKINQWTCKNRCTKWKIVQMSVITWQHPYFNSKMFSYGDNWQIRGKGLSSKRWATHCIPYQWLNLIHHFYVFILDVTWRRPTDITNNKWTHMTMYSRIQHQWTCKSCSSHLLRYNMTYWMTWKTTDRQYSK